MLGLEMLDVAIGIIFVFLLLSLICSAINEIVESKLKLRAVDLEQGIRGLLNDPKKNAAGTADIAAPANAAGKRNFTEELYSHPLIYSLYRGDYNTAEMRNAGKGEDQKRYSRGSSLPSYIPSRNFALGLMDVLLPAQPAGEKPGGTAGALSRPPDTIPVPTAGGGQQQPANPNPLQPLRAAVMDIQHNDNLQKALLSIIDAAGNDAIKVREGIENWYNSAMDRVSGWYKRRVQRIVFFMGFGLAIIMNADSISIFTNLSNDRPLRDAIVSAAKDYKDSSTTAANANERIRQNVGTLEQMGLPIGWGWKNSLNNGRDAISNFKAIPAFDDHHVLRSLGPWALKIFGWFITGMAISMGAPFWFDMLSKIMVVRSTVKPHEKSPEEASQDRQK